MHVVAHNSVSDYFNREDVHKRAQAEANPSLAMFERLSAKTVFAAKKRSPNASTDAVIDANFVAIYDLATRICHMDTVV